MRASNMVVLIGYASMSLLTSSATVGSLTVTNGTAIRPAPSQHKPKPPVMTPSGDHWSKKMPADTVPLISSISQIPLNRTELKPLENITTSSSISTTTKVSSNHSSVYLAGSVDRNKMCTFFTDLSILSTLNSSLVANTSFVTQMDALPGDSGNSPLQPKWLELGVNCDTFEMENSIDTSAEQSPTEPIWRYPAVWTVALCVAYLVVFFLGLVGNLSVLWVIFILRRSTRHSMFATCNKVFNGLIGNLALADLLVIIFCLPATLIGNIFTPWILGRFVCKAVPYLQGVSVSASVYTLVAISIDRFYGIYYPFNNGFSPVVRRTVIICIWLLSLIIAMPWILFFDIVSRGQFVMCQEVWPEESILNAYFLVVNLGFQYLLPLSIILVFYVLLFMKISRRKIPVFHSVCRRETSTDTVDQWNARIVEQSKMKVLKMLIVIVSLFALSWLPLYIIFVRLKFGQQLDEYSFEGKFLIGITPLAQWLGASNSCVNPILYFFFNAKFRAYLKKAITRNLLCSSSVDYTRNHIYTNQNNNNNNNHNHVNNVQNNHQINSNSHINNRHKQTFNNFNYHSNNHHQQQQQQNMKNVDLMNANCKSNEDNKKNVDVRGLRHCTTTSTNSHNGTDSDHNNLVLFQQTNNNTTVSQCRTEQQHANLNIPIQRNDMMTMMMSMRMKMIISDGGGSSRRTIVSPNSSKKYPNQNNCISHHHTKFTDRNFISSSRNNPSSDPISSGDDKNSCVPGPNDYDQTTTTASSSSSSSSSSSQSTSIETKMKSVLVSKQYDRHIGSTSTTKHHPKCYQVDCMTLIQLPRPPPNAIASYYGSIRRETPV